MVIVTGCYGPIQVAMSHPVTAEHERSKYQYYAATKLNIGVIQELWSEDEYNLWEAFFGTSLMLADMPTSLAFDICFATPLKAIGSRQWPWPWREVEWPWKEVAHFNRDSISFYLEMSQTDLIMMFDKIEKKDTYQLVSRGEDIWQLWQIKNSNYHARLCEIHIQDGRLIKIYKHLRYRCQ